ncbi:MAG: hypothetical protein Q9173_001733 [Seirophora scorigena]
MAASHSAHDPLHFVTLDVFTRERFKGNPLAIVELLHENHLGQETKQLIAREFNFSETVFLHPPSTEGEDYDRKCDIFTKTEELPFAGHPTIGTLVSLCRDGDAARNTVQSITLQTKAGPIRASFDHHIGVAEANVPHNVRIHRTPVPVASIIDAQPSLSRSAVGLGESCPLVSIVKGMTFMLVDVQEAANLAQLAVGGPRIDPKAVRWDDGWASFTAPYFYRMVSEDEAATRVRIRSRMIEHTVGEDPATGSAASALAAYLALQRGRAAATYTFSIEQGVEMGRHSDIGVAVTLDDRGKSVRSVSLSGSAVVVSQGTMCL